MKSNIKNSLSILLNFVIIYFSFEIIKQKTIQSETLVWSTWSYSELLINYPEKIFVRRGLLGEIFQILANEGPSYKIVQQFVFYNFLVFMLLSTSLLVLYVLKQYQISYFLISSFGFLSVCYCVGKTKCAICAVGSFFAWNTTFSVKCVLMQFRFC